jgi:hypothetical protein
MEQSGLDKLANIIKQFKDICDQIAQNKEDVKIIYSNFDTRKDARITTFSKMIYLFTALQLSLNFVLKGLSKLDVWKIIIDEEPPPNSDKKLYYVGSFMQFTKIGFDELLFSITESSLRIFLRAFDPNACNSSTNTFESIYNCLFKSKLSICPTEGIELLDLFRHTRNTIHNNGVYFNSKKQDKVVIWRGISYEFKHATPISFVTWQHIVNISDAIQSLLYTVITDKNLRVINHEIKDPYQITEIPKK